MYTSGFGERRGAGKLAVGRHSMGREFQLQCKYSILQYGPGCSCACSLVLENLYNRTLNLSVLPFVFHTNNMTTSFSVVLQHFAAFFASTDLWDLLLTFFTFLIKYFTMEDNRNYGEKLKGGGEK